MRVWQKSSYPLHRDPVSRLDENAAGPIYFAAFNPEQ